MISPGLHCDFFFFYIFIYISDAQACTVTPVCFVSHEVSVGLLYGAVLWGMRSTAASNFLEMFDGILPEA